jgi:ribosomal protein L4
LIYKEFVLYYKDKIMSNQEETHGEVEKRGEKSLKKGLTRGARFGKIVEHSARAGAAP